MKRVLRLVFPVVLLVVVLSGCGGGPKADVSLFIMPEGGIQPETVEKLEQAVIAKLGETPTFEAQGSPLFSYEKLLVELAAGGHGIYIVPEEQFMAYVKQGGFVPLDEYFDPEKYEEGVVTVDITERQEDGTEVVVDTVTHLYGIPMHKSALFEELGFNGEGLFAFIGPRLKSREDALEVLKLIVEGE